MIGPYRGLTGVPGPMWPPVRPALAVSDRSCVCDATQGQSCRWCTGDADTEREIRRSPGLSTEVAAWTPAVWEQAIRDKHAEHENRGAA